VPAQYVRATLRRAKAEADAGRRWRAKEILQGSLACQLYALEPEFLEAYGALLDSLGDRFEAGKYLFLSGKRSDAYAEAIEIYLHRTRRTPVSDLVGQFPAAIRRHGLGHLPEVVRRELEERGARPEDLQRREPLIPAASPLGWRDRVVIGGIISAFVLLLATSIVGCVAIVRWAF
jgi:hypothetical protein